jgi:hypothetical protein
MIVLELGGGCVRQLLTDLPMVIILELAIAYATDIRLNLLRT